MADFTDMPDAEEEEQVQQQEQEEQEQFEQQDFEQQQFEQQQEQFEQEEFVDVQSESVLPEPEEEDALSKFNAEWNTRLALKKEAEDALDRKSEANAQTDINNFNSQREARLNAKKEINRSEEQVYLEQQESELEGNTWDRVTKLVETSQDEAETDKADVSRMRKLFIQLKNEPLESTRSAAVESN